jgi:glycosyltransferase involved in cell wall biosynthesis
MAKSIVFLGGRGLNSNYGGVENAIREIVVEMSKKPVDIKVYGVTGDIDQEFTPADNVKSVTIPNGIYKKLGQHGYILFCVLHILLTSRPAVVVIFASGPCIFTPVFRLSGIKVITSLRAIDSARDKWGPLSRNILQLGEYCSWKFANHFTANSKAMVLHFKEKRSDINFIPNGAKGVTTADSERIYSLGLKENNYFLFAARLDPVKRLHILLAAHAKLAESEKLPLIIAGGHVKDKAYEAELKKYASDKVIFLGHLNSEQLDPLMYHCRAFVQPSILEGMSNSLLTAMATSKAIIAADIPENRDVVKLEDALYQKDNTFALYAKLNKCSLDIHYCDQLGRKLNDISKSEFSWNKTSNKFYSLINECINER